MRKVVIFDFNRTIYNPETKKLFPNVVSILIQLKSSGCVLFLLSFGGKERTQQILDLGITSYFDKVYVSKSKVVAFRKLVVERALQQANTFVVGDRIKEEIRIGNMYGFQTVWLKKGIFAEELPKDLLEFPVYKIRNLRQFLKLVIPLRR